MFSSIIAVTAALCVFASACSNGEASTCIDRDRDDFGEGCMFGPDCDETNPLRTNNCERVPSPDCSLNPLLTGCPCLVGSVANCYGGALGTENVGHCIGGRAVCVNGTWGLCAGSVEPRFELCNAVDDDCDGVTDDGVRSPCGGCDETCQGGVWGEQEAPFTATTDLALTTRGYLTLARDDQVQGTVWVANSDDGTLSKIDAASAIEVARYDTGGTQPSRVAVDYEGDAWVLNREFGAQGSVTKFAGDESRCIDVDGDGLETSHGPSELLIFGEDECMLLHTDVGEVNEVPRAMAVDGASGGGHVWIGLHDGFAIEHRDGDTGALLTRIETPEFQPYGAGIDPWGQLWMIERDGHLLSLDTNAATPVPTVVEVPLPCYLLYGLDIDHEGRLLLSGFSCDQVIAFDAISAAFTPLATPPSTRGVAFDEDDVAWVSHTDGRLSRITSTPLALDSTFSLANATHTPIESIGTSVDSLGHVWVVSEEGGDDGRGVATRVNRSTSIVEEQVTVGRAPHTQGDMTGASLRGAFAPEGVTSHVFDGCVGGETMWIAAHVSAMTSAASTVQVEVRHAAERSSLEAATFVTLGVLPADGETLPLSFDVGGVVEVRLTLRASARVGAPRVMRVGLEWLCPGPV